MDIGDIMANEDIVKIVEDTLNKSLTTTKECLDESLKATNEISNRYLELNQKTMQNYHDLVDKYADLVVEYSNFVASDIVDSYNKMIELRKECIDKYINFYSMMFKDEKDVDLSKPIKSLLLKQQEDVEKWQKEIAPLLELKNIDDNTSDEKANEILESFKNI